MKRRRSIRVPMSSQAQANLDRVAVHLSDSGCDEEAVAMSPLRLSYRQIHWGRSPEV